MSSRIHVDFGMWSRLNFNLLTAGQAHKVYQRIIVSEKVRTISSNSFHFSIRLQEV